MIALIALILAQAAPARVLTLQEAQRLAQERQPQLRAAHGTTQAAEGRVEQTRAPLLPQLSATAGWERSTNNFIFRPGVTLRSGLTNSWDTISYFNTSVTLSQLVWDFGQTSDRWRSSEASARATAQQERATGSAVLLQVRTAFFNAVAYKELLSVAREMMISPELMLVDEPTAGLATALVAQIYELLHAARRAGSTILLVDQNIEDAVREADHVYLVDLGRIRAHGPAREFPLERVSALIRECLLG